MKDISPCVVLLPFPISFTIMIKAIVTIIISVTITNIWTMVMMMMMMTTTAMIMMIKDG